MTPYHEQTLRKRNLFQKLFNLEPQDNCFLELNNLLAEKPVLDITRKEVKAILEDYGVEKAPDDRKEELIKPMIAHVLLDGIIDEEEREQLNHLCEILDMDASVVERLLHTMSHSLYRDAFATAISDGYLSAEEEEALENLRITLNLPKEQVEELEKKMRKEFLEEQLQEALADQMLSPAEEEQLEKTARNLKTEINFSDNTNTKLQKFRRYWQLRYGSLPPINVNYNLYNKEDCFARLPATWCEWKTQTTRYNYGGPALRVKVAKGLYWRAGSVGVQRMKEDVLETIDEGELLVTNKRLLFVGARNTKNIRLNRILDFDVFANGLQVRKDAGKHPFIKIHGSFEELPLLLERLLGFDD